MKRKKLQGFFFSRNFSLKKANAKTCFLVRAVGYDPREMEMENSRFHILKEVKVGRLWISTQILVLV